MTMVFQCHQLVNRADENINVTLPVNHTAENITTPLVPALYAERNPLEVLQWWVEVPVIGVLCVVGLVANTLAIVAWHSQTEHRRSLFIIQVLAVTNNFYLLITALALSISQIFPQVKFAFDQVAPLIFYLQNTAQSLCIWMIVLVTTERFVYITRPLQAPQMLRMNRKWWLVGLVFAFSILYNLPFLLCYCVHDGRKVHRPGIDQHLMDVWFESVSRFVLMYFIPLVVLIVMTVMLVRAITVLRRPQTLKSITHTDEIELNHLQKMDDQGEEAHITIGSTPSLLSASGRLVSPQSVKNERRSTTLLVIIVIMFMFCQLPEVIYNTLIYVLYFWPSAILPLTLSHLTLVSNVALVINSSTNFFVYFFLASQFRRRVLFIFKCKGDW